MFYIRLEEEIAQQKHPTKIHPKLRKIAPKLGGLLGRVWGNFHTLAIILVRLYTLVTHKFVARCCGNFLRWCWVGAWVRFGLGFWGSKQNLFN